MSIVKSFNVNGLDSSLNLASETENGLMSSENYSELTILNQTFQQFQSDEFGYGITDSLGTLLFGIKWDGTTYIPKGIPEEVQEQLEVVDNLQIMQNDDYCFAVTDNTSNLMFGISWSGSTVINSLAGVCQIEQFDTKEFIYAVIDSKGNLLFGVRLDGTFVMSKWQVPEKVSDLMGMVSKDKNPEFAWRVQDNNGRILIGTYWDGTTYIPKGVPEEVKPFIEKANKRLADLEKQLENFVGGTGDWSDYSSLEIPMPRCAMVNISGIDAMPTSKTANYKGYLEFWDLQGNYFKKTTIFNAQGSYSMSLIKKNIAVDICNDNWIGDDTFSLRIGDWVSQDSFHLKAYYTEMFRGIGVCAYQLYDEICKTRGIYADREWKKALVDYTNIKYTQASFGDPVEDDLELQFDTGARCFPDGFPCIVYLNSEFYGIFSWQLKKHRDNMHQDKDTAEHIHLDGYINNSTIFGGTVDWTQFEIRNPKNLYTADGSEYDGDSPVEIASQTTIDEWITAGTLPDGTTISSKIKKRLNTTGKVKEYIMSFSSVLSTINTAASVYESSSKTDNDLQTFKDVFETYFDADNLIDYIIVSDIINNTDGFDKNWQWFTYDGLKWHVTLYDTDITFGCYIAPNHSILPKTSHVNTSTSLPVGYVIKYYTAELDTRYKELAEAGIINAEHIISLINEWSYRIGVDNYSAEYEKWPDTPCIGKSTVNEDYWELVTDDNERPVTGSSSTYSSTTTYSIGSTCYYGTASELGYYQFKAVTETTDNVPATTFKCPDSIYRVQKWIKQEVSNMDTVYNYTRK